MVAVEDKLVETEKTNVADDDGIITSPQAVIQSKEKSAVSEKTIPEQIEVSGETSSVEDSSLVKTDTTGECNTTPDTVTEKTETDDVLAATDRTLEKLEIESEISLTDPNQTNLPELSQSEVEQDLMEPLTLEVEASEGTWISISVDGNEAKDIRLGADEIHQWEAKKEYLLTLGNTHAVRILLNGREIETNRTHQLLTDWVIDKSFLP